MKVSIIFHSYFSLPESIFQIRWFCEFTRSFASQSLIFEHIFFPKHPKLWPSFLLVASPHWMGWPTLQSELCWALASENPGFFAVHPATVVFCHCLFSSCTMPMPPCLWGFRGTQLQSALQHGSAETPEVLGSMTVWIVKERARWTFAQMVDPWSNWMVHPVKWGYK